MDIITNLNLATAAELAVIAAVSGLATQALKKMTKLPSWVLPWASIIIGGLGGLVAVLVTHDSNYASAALAGALTGGATSGLFDGVSGAASAVQATSTAKRTVVDENAALKKEVDGLKTLVGILQGGSNTAASQAASATSAAPAPVSTGSAVNSAGTIAIDIPAVGSDSSVTK